MQNLIHHKVYVFFIIFLLGGFFVPSAPVNASINQSSVINNSVPSLTIFLEEDDDEGDGIILNPCLNPVDIPDEELHWVYIPQDPSELNTRISYYFLAGQLIKSGAIDASNCPNGGMSTTDYPNACGLAEAKDLVFELQNLYDEEILLAWEEVGTPPVLLKQLIRYESHFWPGSWGLYHNGLGHMTYDGAHTGLLWNFSLFREICSTVGNGVCSNSVTPEMVYGLLDLMNADIPDSEYGIDASKAERSVHYLSQTVMGYCKQSSQIVYNSTGRSAGEVVDFVTIWRMTLLNYNSGAVCLYDTLQKIDQNKDGDYTVTWDDIENYLAYPYCQRGIDYANSITEKTYNFPPPEAEDSDE